MEYAYLAAGLGAGLAMIGAAIGISEETCDAEPSDAIRDCGIP